jgi:hypothetical protein
MSTDVTNTVETRFTARDIASAALSRIRRSALAASKAVNALSGTLGSIKNITAKVSVAVAGGAVLTAAAGALAQINGEKEALAKSVGQDVNYIDAIAFRVQNLGLDYESVIDLAEELTNKLGEQASVGGVTAVTDALTILGIKFEDIKNLSQSDQFKKVFEAGLSVKDAQKAAAAFDILLGGEGNKTIGYLRSLGLTNDEIINSFNKINFLTKQGRDGFTKFAQQFSRTQKIIATVAQDAFGNISSSIEPLLNRLNSFLIENKKSIQENIKQYGDQFAAAVARIDFERIKGYFATFTSAIPSIVDQLKQAVSVAKQLAETFLTIGQAIINASNKVIDFINALKSIPKLGIFDAFGGSVFDTPAGQAAAGNTGTTPTSRPVRIPAAPPGALSVNSSGVATSATLTPNLPRNEPYVIPPIDGGFSKDSEVNLSQAKNELIDLGRQLRSGNISSEVTDESINRQAAAIAAQLKGSLNLNVSVRAEQGATVTQTGSTNSSPLVGNVGFTAPAAQPINRGGR